MVLTFSAQRTKTFWLMEPDCHKDWIFHVMTFPGTVPSGPACSAGFD